MATSSAEGAEKSPFAAVLLAGWSHVHPEKCAMFDKSRRLIPKDLAKAPNPLSLESRPGGTMDERKRKASIPEFGRMSLRRQSSKDLKT